MDDDVKRLLSDVFRLQLAARDLAVTAEKLYDRAITIAVHDAECMSRHPKRVKVPVKASEEEL